MRLRTVALGLGFALWIAIIWIGAWLADAASQEPAKAAPVAPEPPRVIDFTLNPPPILVGPETDELRFEVPIENRDSQPVHFERFLCACACTKSRLAQESLQPGEKSVVQISVSPSLRTGKQEFLCHWDDRPFRRRWRAIVNVELVRPLQFADSKLSFGAVRAGEMLVRESRFQEFARSEAELGPEKRWTTSSPDLTIRPQGTEIRPVGNGLICRETRLECRWKVPNQSGPAIAHVQVEQDPSKNPLAVSLALECLVQQGITMNPSMLTIIPTESQELSRQIVLQSDDGKPFRILSVKSELPFVQKATFDAELKERQVITFPIDRSVLPMRTYGKIQMEIEKEQEPTKTLDLPYLILIPEIEKGN